MSITLEVARTVIKSGNFYYPAYSHYNNGNNNVVCDLCARDWLFASIGYMQYDLCLTCANYVTSQMSQVQQSLIDVQKTMKDNVSATFMMQDSTRSPVITFMMQNSVRSSTSIMRFFKNPFK